MRVFPNYITISHNDIYNIMQLHNNITQLHNTS